MLQQLTHIVPPGSSAALVTEYWSAVCYTIFTFHPYPLPPNTLISLNFSSLPVFIPHFYFINLTDYLFQ